MGKDDCLITREADVSWTIIEEKCYFWLHISCFELSSEVMDCVCVFVCVCVCVVGAVLLVSVQGIAVNVDPVLSSWLLFQPQRTSGSRQTQQVQLCVCVCVRETEVADAG